MLASHTCWNAGCSRTRCSIPCTATTRLWLYPFDRCVRRVNSTTRRRLKQNKKQTETDFLVVQHELTMCGNFPEVVEDVQAENSRLTFYQFLETRIQGIGPTFLELFRCFAIPNSLCSPNNRMFINLFASHTCPQLPEFAIFCMLKSSWIESNWIKFKKFCSNGALL